MWSDLQEKTALQTKWRLCGLKFVNKHITDKKACSSMYIRDEDIKTAFLRMIYKLQTAHDQVLKPFLL